MGFGTFLTREDIDRQFKTNTPELLQGMAGMKVRRIGNEWKITSHLIGGRSQRKPVEEKSHVTMAEIKPLRAWRYNDSLDIDELTSPLFDVVRLLIDVHTPLTLNQYLQLKQISPSF